MIWLGLDRLELLVDLYIVWILMNVVVALQVFEKISLNEIIKLFSLDIIKKISQNINKKKQI